MPAIALLLASLAAPALAQEPAAAAYVDRPVSSNAVIIEGRPAPDPALLDAIQSKQGAPLKMTDVRETIMHLYSLGRFEDVRVDATLDNGRVVLRYDLIPIHPVGRIRFAISAEAPGVAADAMRRADTIPAVAGMPVAFPS